jgi:hypothetical protein
MGAVGVRNAFHARASRDFFREFVWQAKGLVFQLSRSSFRPRVFALLGVKHLMQKQFAPGSVFA